jgi:hypothetical protein
VWGGRREGDAAALSACRTTSSPGSRSEARCALIYVDVGAYLGSLELTRGVGWKEGGMKVDEGAAALSACVGLRSRGRETFILEALWSGSRMYYVSICLSLSIRDFGRPFK